MILPKLIRSAEKFNNCNCNICLTARNHAKNKRITSESFDHSNGLIGSIPVIQLPNNERVKKVKLSVSICSLCTQETGPGVQH